MTYPIRSVPDGDTAWGGDLRAVIAGVNDHQNRINSIESLASTSRTASFSVTASDVGVEQVYNSASSGTCTLPSNSTSAIPIGKSIPLRMGSTGVLTVAAGTGATLEARGSAFKLAGTSAVAEARKISTDGWLLYGDITT